MAYYDRSASRSTCTTDAFGNVTTCLADQTTFETSFEYNPANTCDPAADTCVTTLGPNYRCLSLDDGTGTPTDVCAQPTGRCGMSIPILTDVTTAALDAVIAANENCNVWTIAYDGTQSYFAPPSLCEPLGATTGALPAADVQCTETNSLTLYAGGTFCSSDAECTATGSTCNLTYGTCSCAINADCPGADWCHPAGICIWGCDNDIDCLPSGLVCVQLGSDNACSYFKSVCLAWCESRQGVAWECPGGQVCSQHDIDKIDESTGWPPPDGIPDILAFRNAGITFQVDAGGNAVLCSTAADCDPTAVLPFDCIQTFCVRRRQVCSQ